MPKDFHMSKFLGRLTKTRALILFMHNGANQRDVNIDNVRELMKVMNDGDWEPRQWSEIEIMGNEIWEGQHRLLAFIFSDLEELYVWFSISRRFDKDRKKTA